MRVPLVDPTADHEPLMRQLAGAAERVIASGRFVLGPEVEHFEEALAAFVGARYAVGVSSGSDALVASLLALGIGSGDEVIVPAFSFVASAECVLRVGAIPRFVDVRPDTLNLDETTLDETIGPQTRAIIAVHLYGTPCAMDRIGEIAKSHGIAVVEDAAQALGATYRSRAAGTWGTLGCFSFFPSKPLGALGDGGAIVTDDSTLAEACRRIRQHGLSHARGPAARLGGNYRLDALQAALLGVKLPRLPGWLEQRRQHARAYDEALSSHPDIELPPVPAEARSARGHYTIRVPAEHRAPLVAHLESRGIASAVYYEHPLPAQPLFADFAGDDPFAVAHTASARVLSLPLYPSLTEAQRGHVLEAVAAYPFRQTRANRA